MSILSRYHGKNRELIETEDILEKYFDDYEKKYGLYFVIFKWHLILLDNTFHVTSKRMINVSKCYLRKYLLSKNCFFSVVMDTNFLTYRKEYHFHKQI